MWSAHIASNMNFPGSASQSWDSSPPAVGLVLAAALQSLIFWFARKPRFARIAPSPSGLGLSSTSLSCLAFSAGSHETDLARGQEKYFCEIDCHLAYSVVDVNDAT